MSTRGTSQPSSATPHASAGAVRTAASTRTLDALRLPLAIAGAGVVAALVAGILTARDDAARATAVFERRAASLDAAITQRFESASEIAFTLPLLFEASEHVSSDEFGRFATPALQRHTGIATLQYLPIVPGDSRDAFEREVQAWRPGFEIRDPVGPGLWKRAPERPVHVPVLYMVPPVDTVFGLDLMFAPDRAAHLQRAASSEPFSVTPPFSLAQDLQGDLRVLLHAPVHAGPTRDDGTRELSGYVSQHFDIRDVVEQAARDLDLRGIAFTLRDVTDRPEGDLLVAPAQDLDDLVTQGWLTTRRPIPFANRDWQLVVAGDPMRQGTRRWSWIIAPAVLALFLAAAIVVALLRRVHRLEAQVNAGRQLGQYRLLQRIGAGGMGDVYRVQHALLRRPAAMKLLRDTPGDGRRRQRFEREVRHTSELAHPNTIVIHDFGQTPDGIFYYVMEHIDGFTLDEIVEHGGPMPPERVVHILRQVCGSIAEAHAAHIVHRDVKPGNIMLCDRGGVPDFAKVLDFGLVKFLDDHEDRSALSLADSIVGTPLFVSPEAIEAPHRIGPASDVYALGAVAWFLLVGRPLFAGANAFDVCARHVTQPAPAPSTETQGPIPPELDAIVLRCLNKSPDDRFRDAAELLDALDELSIAPAWTADRARAWWNEHLDALRALRERRLDTLNVRQDPNASTEIDHAVLLDGLVAARQPPT